MSDGDRPVAVEVDLSTAEEFRMALERVLDGHDRIEIDLHETTFMDSTGLAVLVGAHRRLGHDRAALVLRDPSPMILRLA